MGQATVVSAQSDGLYTITVDTGTSLRDDAIVKIDARLAKLATEIAELEPAVVDAENALNSAISDLNSKINAFIAAPQDNNLSQKSAVVAATALAVEADADLQISKIRLSELEFEKSAIEEEKARLNLLVLEEDVEAWCADLTVASGSTVATIEIPGENGTILVAPGAVAPSEDYGKLIMRDVQKGHQCYYNAAILPGWQKFSPTYRFAEITSFNGDLCNVTIDAETSSAQSLDINQSIGLVDVPIEYMTCHSAAFDVGDRVVVNFIDQNWSQPRVIGFETNPKSCSGYICYPNSSPALIFPSLGGGPPNVTLSPNNPDKIEALQFGGINCFSHESNGLTISSGQNIAFFKGKVIFVSLNKSILSCFAVNGGRFIIIVYGGNIYSTGTVNSTTSAYDENTNPDGFTLLGNLPHFDHIHIRPDGGKIYGFDDVGYCSASFVDDGFSVSVSASTLHQVTLDSDVITTATGTPRDTATEIVGQTGEHGSTTTKNLTYSAAIGVYWTGSAGSWSENIVSFDYLLVSSGVTNNVWERLKLGAFGSHNDYKKDTTSTTTVTMNGGPAYQKTIYSSVYVEDFTETTDLTTHTIDANITTLNGSSNMVRIMGRGDYFEEFDNCNFTMAETISGTSVTHTASITLDGNTANHNGQIVASGVTFSYDVDRSGTTGDGQKRGGLIPRSDHRALWVESGDLENNGYGALDVVQANSGDRRIAQSASTFMLAEIEVNSVMALENNEGDLGILTLRGPYLSSYGFIESQLGLGEGETGYLASLY